MLAPYNVIPELVILMYNVLLYAHINAFFIPISQYLGVLSFFFFNILFSLLSTNVRAFGKILHDKFGF